MTAMCPHCGYDLERSEVIERGAYVLHPDGLIYRDGERIRVTPQEGQLLYTVAKAGGEPVHCRIVGERISDSEHPYNLAQVLLTKLRVKFRSAGLEFPISTINSFGVAWT